MSVHSDRRPFRIAELAYQPWSVHPWLVVRTGSVADQGGLRFGTEAIAFATLDEAALFIEQATQRDLPVIDSVVKEKDKWRDSEDSLP